MRIGLFGGTFNPIHYGHLRTTREVKEHFRLDKICLIPSALPPHKEASAVANASDRIEMIRLAVARDPDFYVSDVELKRPGPSFTIDTVYHFKSQLPEDTELFLIMGLDAFLEIDTWKSYSNLFVLIPFIILSRPGAGYSDSHLQWKALEDYLKSKISDDYTFSSSKSCYVHGSKEPVFRMDVSPQNISSTKIRRRVQKGLSIQSLVPEKVEAFIKIKGLYL
jgi:nicotinate-nucleotide adenylyltransferase